MLYTLHTIAKRIYFLRFTLLVLANILAAFCIFSITSGNSDFDRYIPLSVTLFGWFFCLYGIANGFIILPSSIEHGDKWFKRLQKKIKLFMAWLFASMFFICTFGLLYVSYSVIKLSFAGN